MHGYLALFGTFGVGPAVSGPGWGVALGLDIAGMATLVSI